MAYEISQFDLASRQLLTDGVRPASKTCTEIGNAKITQSIFGNAKVRISCAQDRIRRVRLLSTILAITITGAIWQVTEYGEKLFATNTSESVNTTVQVSTPAFMPEYIPPSAATQRQNNLRNPTPAEIYQLTTSRLPPPPPLVKNSANAAANPATAEPLVAGTQQATPLTAPRTSPPGASTIPAGTQQVPKPAAVTTPPSTQPVAGKPIPVAPPTDKEAAAAKPLSAPIQPAQPASTQPE